AIFHLISPRLRTVTANCRSPGYTLALVPRRPSRRSASGICFFNVGIRTFLSNSAVLRIGSLDPTSAEMTAPHLTDTNKTDSVTLLRQMIAADPFRMSPAFASYG